MKQVLIPVKQLLQEAEKAKGTPSPYWSLVLKDSEVKNYPEVLAGGDGGPASSDEISLGPSITKYSSSMVNHPSHYNTGKIEVIEAIEDWKLGYHLGNTVKYCARAGKKDPTKEIEDLEKAQWYLKRKIELLKAEKENREITRPNDMNPRGTL